MWSKYFNLSLQQFALHEKEALKKQPIPTDVSLILKNTGGNESSISAWSVVYL